MIESGIIDEIEDSPSGSAMRSDSLTLFNSCWMIGFASLSNVSRRYLWRSRHKIFLTTQFNGWPNPCILTRMSSSSITLNSMIKKYDQIIWKIEFRLIWVQKYILIYRSLPVNFGCDSFAGSFCFTLIVITILLTEAVTSPLWKRR